MHTKKIRLFILLSLLWFSLLGLWYTMTSVSLIERVQQETLIIAHRGSSSTAPENSFAAVEQAHLAGADLIELDFFIARDGGLFVHHDELKDEQPIPELSTEKFQQLDISQEDKFAQAYTQVHPPLLEPMLEKILSQSTPLIEYKRNSLTPDESAQKASDALLEILNRRGWRNRVIIQSFDVVFLFYCRSQAPDLILGWLVRDDTIEHIKTIEKEIKPDIIAWKREMLTPEIIEALHTYSNARIWAWYSGQDKTNDPAYTLDMIKKGISGIITDYPAQARVVHTWSVQNQILSP